MLRAPLLHVFVDDAVIWVTSVLPASTDGKSMQNLCEEHLNVQSNQIVSRTSNSIWEETSRSCVVAEVNDVQNLQTTGQIY